MGTLVRLIAAASSALVAIACGPAPGNEPTDAGPPPGKDPFIWGTEAALFVLPDGGIPTEVAAAIRAIKITGVRTVKLRVNAPDPATGTSFPTEQCLEYRLAATPAQCLAYADLAKTAAEFGRNGLSMAPMISPHPKGFDPNSADHREHFASYVEWFVKTYRGAAAIEYVELVNAPVQRFAGKSAQLIDLQNRTFDKVKVSSPDVRVGTPGFEYDVDAAASAFQLAKDFLDPATGVSARFDFWAFHGYPPKTCVGTGCTDASVYPPTKTTLQSVFAGPSGFDDLRAAFDKNGWTSRRIIDTEHVPPYHGPGMTRQDDYDAAYLVQESVVKRSVRQEGGLALGGSFPLKLRVRSDGAEGAWGALNPDGAPTKPVTAYGLLVSKLKDCAHVTRVSGAFDQESQAWVEQFACPGKTTYVAFKPFTYTAGLAPGFDSGHLSYTLNLSGMPRRVTQTSATDGTSDELTPAQSVQLDLSNSPVYLEVEP